MPRFQRRQLCLIRATNTWIPALVSVEAENLEKALDEFALGRFVAFEEIKSYSVDTQTLPTAIVEVSVYDLLAELADDDA